MPACLRTNHRPEKCHQYGQDSHQYNQNYNQDDQESYLNCQDSHEVAISKDSCEHSQYCAQGFKDAQVGQNIFLYASAYQ